MRLAVLCCALACAAPETLHERAARLRADVQRDSDASSRASHLLQLSDAYSELQQHVHAAAAAAQYLKALGLGTRPAASDLVHAYSLLARELRGAGKLEAALKAVERGLEILAGGAGEPVALLRRLESGIHACAGRSHAALAAFRQSLAATSDSLDLEGSGVPDSAPQPLAAHRAQTKPYTVDQRLGKDPSIRLELLDTLRRAGVAASALGGDTDAGVRFDLGDWSTDAGELVHDILSAGPWVRSDQLPLHYQPGLAARPWHSVPDHWPQLAMVAAVLQGATAALQAEYAALQSRGLLIRESECIVNATTAPPGQWHYYTVNAPWVPQDAATGCSVDAPAACGLLTQLRQLRLPHNLRLLRAGYSSLSPGTHLQPHYGASNSQLKFHLGLVVPRGADGHSCAFLRVGTLPSHVTIPTRSMSRGFPVRYAEPAGGQPSANGARRGGDGSHEVSRGLSNSTFSEPPTWTEGGAICAWTEGGLLLFDDSFEHEALNACATERVVFQLVFEHPDAAALRARPSPANHVIPAGARGASACPDSGESELAMRAEGERDL
jgi:tetratricopeptide (TPR) repeat protein